MGEHEDKPGRVKRADINSLEADAAFFDARLSLANRQQDTVYQKAQKRTYEMLGKVLNDTLQKLRAKPGG
jgi:hypothetical protein